MLLQHRACVPLPVHLEDKQYNRFGLTFALAKRERHSDSRSLIAEGYTSIAWCSLVRINLLLLFDELLSGCRCILEKIEIVGLQRCAG